MSAEGSAEKDVPQFPVPEGWLPFGSLIDYDGPSECSEEVGEDGLPLWERPIPPGETEDVEPDLDYTCECCKPRVIPPGGPR